MALVRNDLPLGESVRDMSMERWSTTTPIGPFSVVVREGRVVAAGFTDDIIDLLLPGSVDGIETTGKVPDVSDRIDAYFAGDVTAIDAIPIAPVGSERKKDAWSAMRRIPPGAMSYRDLSTRMTPPASPRSAARACATNPVALVVPCHRFIGSDGTLHGYYWGLDRKRWLLDHEERFTP